MPADITNILKAAALLLAMFRNAAAYDPLLRLVPAFDPDGQPDVEAERKPPGRFVVAISRTAEGINGLSTMLKSTLAIVAIIIAMILYAPTVATPANFSASRSEPGQRPPRPTITTPNPGTKRAFGPVLPLVSSSLEPNAAFGYRPGLVFRPGPEPGRAQPRCFTKARRRWP